MVYAQLPDEWKEWLDVTSPGRFRRSEERCPHTWRWEAALIPPLIRQVLSIFKANCVQALLLRGAEAVESLRVG